MKKLAIFISFLFAFAFVFAFVGKTQAQELEPCPLVAIAKTEIVDEDIDKVYFPGDTLTFEFEGIVQATREYLRVGFVVWNTSESFLYAEVIDGLTLEDGVYVKDLGIDDFTIEEHYFFNDTDKISFGITGIIQEGLLTGALGIVVLDGSVESRNIQYPLVKEMIVNGTPQNAWEMYPTHITRGADCVPVEPVISTTPALVGIPSVFGDVTSNIDDIANLYDTEKELIFEKEEGSISFDSGLDVIGSREQLTNLEDFVTIIYDEEMNEMRIEVNTNNLTFLAEHSATIHFFNVAALLGIEGLTVENFRDFLEVNVFDVLDEDSTVSNIETEVLADYFDWDNATYDAEEDTLTLPVNHFTAYVLGEISAEEEIVEETAEETITTRVEEEEETEEEILPQTGAAIIGIFSLGIISLITYFVLKRYKVLV